MARKSLARSATGLPRFYLDCGFWRTRTFRALPLDALALWVCMVGACNEQATDGRLPADPEDLAAAVGLRLSRVKKPLATLITAGRITIDGDELEIVGFSDHNPTSKEVAEYTEERSRQGGRGNHIRWHMNKARWAADCPMCVEDHRTCPSGWEDISGPDPDPPPDRPSDPPEDRSSDRSSDPDTIAHPIANSSHGMGWDGMGTKQVVSPTGLGTPPPETTTDDDENPTSAVEIPQPMSQPDPPSLDELARHVAQARSARLGGGHNAGWIRAVTAGIDRARLGQHHAAGVTDPAELDKLLDDTRPEPTQLQAVTTGPHPAIAAARRPECPTCHDNRIIETHGIASRCPDCATRIQETRAL